LGFAIFKQRRMMENNYQKIVQENLNRLFSDLPSDFDKRLPGLHQLGGVTLRAFGRDCWIGEQGIRLDGKPENGVVGILISLYALNAKTDPCRLEPLKSYKDFPNSMPYSGAFTTHTEHLLLPKVQQIKGAQNKILTQLNGRDTADTAGGDFSFLVYPLPKIALCYVFYEADEDFSASVTCLFSNNANRFLPMDALADVGEYTSKAIVRIIGAPTS
jgi:hypothetical protein